ncbi:MAG: SdiA-regulated domain-containing protein [Gemmatimonadaceae bacterium]
MIVRHCTLSLLVTLGAVACGMRGDAASAVDSAELTGRAARIAQRLSDSTSGAARGVPIARWWLPTSLNEVSGLTMTSDGRLLAHGDEYGTVAVLDPRRGVLLKEFSIGAKADFEGITIADGVIYMVASNGEIYVFREGANRERVRYERLDTRLGRECEFEGIAFDHVRRALLLPCKNVKERSLRNNLVIYVWRLAPVTPRLSVLAIPLRRVIGDNTWEDLRPTDIAVDPNTGHYLLVAASERALVELTPNGEVVHAMPLPGREHAQAEGIAITEDGILIIGDEATSRFAAITLYRWPLNEGPAGTP